MVSLLEELVEVVTVEEYNVTEVACELALRLRERFHGLELMGDRDAERSFLNGILKLGE